MASIKIAVEGKGCPFVNCASLEGDNIVRIRIDNKTDDGWLEIAIDLNSLNPNPQTESTNES